MTGEKELKASCRRFESEESERLIHTAAEARPWVVRASLALAGTVVALSLGELGVRAVLAASGWKELFSPDADFGWRGKAGFSGEVRRNGAPRPWKLVINQSGWPGPDVPPRRVQGKKRTLILSDSFGFGGAVDYDRSLVGRLESLWRDREILNLSMDAYGTDQEFLVLEREAPKWDWDEVVVLIYENDFEDVLYEKAWHRHKPRFVMREGRPFLLPFSVPLIDRALGWSALLRLGVMAVAPTHGVRHGDSTTGIELVAALLEQIKESAYKKGNRAYFFFHSQLEKAEQQSDEADSQWILFCKAVRARGVTVDRLDRAILAKATPIRAAALLGFDRIHWTEEGCRLAAECLTEEMYKRRAAGDHEYSAPGPPRRY
jgi:hypothetical protein